LALGFKDVATKGLVVRAASEVDVNVAWTDKERNEEQVEYETYSSIQKREADSKQGNYWPDNNSPLG
jgi:hypothetical protein